jgi:hypothetical protein
VSATLPLILRQEPITRGLLTRMTEPRPNVAVVYADAFGEIAYFQGRPLRWLEQVAARYRVRYEVDLSDHRRTARLDSSPLPSRGNTYFFHSMVDVGFRVTDPAAVVRCNVTDGLAVVYNYLIDTFRSIIREYDIGEATEAEAAINLRFQRPAVLDEGITIYHCRARLVPHAVTEDHQRRRLTRSRSLDFGEAEHRDGMTFARNASEPTEIEQTGRLDADRRKMGSPREPVDLAGLIRAHLSKRPGDTAYALQLLLGYEQAKLEQRGTDDQRLLDLVKYMIDNEIIQAVDVDLLRRSVIREAEEKTELDQRKIAAAVQPSAPSQLAVYDDLVSTAFANLVKPGRILFNPPDQMQLNQTERVEVRLTRTLELDAELLQHLRGPGEPQMEEVPTAPLMAVTLKGDAFQITAYSDEEQGVAQDGITTWEFDIRALKRGSQRLIMCVSLRIPVQGHCFERKSIPVREAIIDVQVRARALVANFVYSNWQ